MSESVVWDAHSCLPIRAGVDCSDLARHRAAGIDYVSVNVGMDFNPVAQITRVIATFRAFILSRPDEYALAGTVAEVRAAKAAGKLAVSFDLEGSDMLADLRVRMWLARSTRSPIVLMRPVLAAAPDPAALLKTIDKSLRVTTRSVKRNVPAVS